MNAGGGWALLWWLLIRSSSALNCCLAVTLMVVADPVGTWSPWWLVLWKRRDVRRRHDPDF